MFVPPQKRMNLIVYLSSIMMLLLSSCGYVTPSTSLPRKIEASSLPVAMLWQSELDEAVNQQPILTDEVVVVSTDQAIYGLATETGQQLWKYKTGYQASPDPIIIIEDKVIYGDRNSQITALDINNGDIIWQRKIRDKQGHYFWVQSFVTDDDVIYVASQPTAIEALNLSTGIPIWSLDGMEVGIPSRAARLFLSNDQLYVFTTEIHILNPETGEIEQVLHQNLTPVQLMNGKFYGADWVRKADDLSSFEQLKSPSTKKLDDGCRNFIPPYTFSKTKYYAVGRCGGVYALDSLNNQIRWEYRPDVLGQSPMAIYHEMLYVLFDDGQIHAVDLESGETQGVLQTNRGLPEYFTDAMGITANELALIVTFYDNNVWAFQ